MSKIVNRRDLDFILYETLNLDEILSKDRYADYDRDAIEAIFDLSQSIAEEKFDAVASKVDANPPKYVDGAAELIPEIFWCSC